MTATLDTPYTEMTDDERALIWDITGIEGEIAKIAEAHGITTTRLDARLAAMIPEATTPRESIERAAEELADNPDFYAED